MTASSTSARATAISLHWPPRLRQTALALLSFLVVLAPLLFTRDTIDAFEYPKSLLLQVTALLLLGLELLRWHLTGQGRSLRPGGMTCAVGLFLASAMLSTLLSRSQASSLWGSHQSQLGLFSVLAYTVVFLLARDLIRDRAEIRVLFLASLVGGILASAYAVAQATGIDPFSWGELSQVGDHLRVTGTMGHPNHLGALAAMSLPVGLLFVQEALRARRWGQMTAAATGTLVLAAALVVSLSRAAWLGAAAGLGFLVLVSLIRSRGRPPIKALAVAGLVLCGCFLLSRLAPRVGVLEAVGKRLRDLTTAGGRPHIWQASWEIFQKYPLTGCGLDALSVAFTQARPAGFIRLEWDAIPMRAHNELFHTLATQGTLGGLALLAVVLCGCRAGWQRVKNADSEDRRFFLVLVAVLLAWLIQAALSFLVVGCGVVVLLCAAILTQTQRQSARDPIPDSSAESVWIGLVGGTVTAVACFLGQVAIDRSSPVALLLLPYLILAIGLSLTLAAASARAERDASPRLDLCFRRRLLSAGACVAGVCLGAWFAVAGVWHPLQASRHALAAEVVLKSGSTDALAFARAATQFAPSRELYWTRRGQTALTLAQAASADERTPLFEEAIAALQHAVQLEPDASFTHGNLGCALAALGRTQPAQRQAAWESLERAIQFDPHHPVYLSRAAWVALSLGKRELACTLARRLHENLPRFGPPLAVLALGHWGESERVEALRLAWLAEESNWSGEIEGASEFTILHAQMELKCNHLKEAAFLARRGSDLIPQDYRPCHVLALVAERQGDVQEAIREHRKTLDRNPAFVPAREQLRRLSALSSGD